MLYIISNGEPCVALTKNTKMLMSAAPTGKIRSCKLAGLQAGYATRVFRWVNYFRTRDVTT